MEKCINSAFFFHVSIESCATPRIFYTNLLEYFLSLYFSYLLMLDFWPFELPPVLTKGTWKDTPCYYCSVLIFVANISDSLNSKVWKAYSLFLVNSSWEGLGLPWPHFCEKYWINNDVTAWSNHFKEWANFNTSLSIPFIKKTFQKE